ncbi:MAG: hypothetical protein HY713_02165 [candidate division NC10 bacterium]|nr:hypothetical protein [candidate division NC10 bacterium]
MWYKRTTRFFPILIYAAVFSNARFFLADTSGIASYLLAAVIVVTPILMAKEAGELMASALGRRIRLQAFTRLALVAGAAVMAFVFIEAALQLLSRLQDPAKRSGALNTLAMPAAWERRPVEIEGAKYAYYWHNILHVHNRDNMRLTGEFPRKRPGTFRVIALGDSLTYGYGIAQEDTYPSVLERELSRLFRIEVLNLGRARAQSEDVYKILQRHLPILHPDLVFYGVCLNDFLPSNVGEYASNRAYEVPLPYKEHFIRTTLTGKLLEKQYDALLMRWGLRVDFLTDILRDFGGYQTRFARDVKAMNAHVRSEGLPPVVAMVLDQFPTTKGKRYEIIQAAEKHLRDAGMRVVPGKYIRRNDGRTDWSVSPWEGHPNEKANRVFAHEIAEVLKDLPELRPYRRSQTTAGRLEATRHTSDPRAMPSQRLRADAAGSERTGRVAHAKERNGR